MDDLTHPATAPDDDLEALLAEPPKWPKVVGIISIVWAALGITCAGIGLGWLAYMPTFMENMAKSANVPPPPPMNVPPAMWAISAVSIGATVLLIVAGISTLARSPRGRTLHLAYAVLAILLFFPSTYVNMQMQTDYQKDMAVYAEQHPDSPFAAQARQGPAQVIGKIVGLVVGAIMGLTWPLFCLLWFTLSKRGTSSMKGTGLEAAA